MEQMADSAGRRHPRPRLRLPHRSLRHRRRTHARSEAGRRGVRRTMVRRPAAPASRIPHRHAGVERRPRRVRLLQNADAAPDFPATDSLGVPMRFTVTGIGGSPESVAYDQGYEPSPVHGHRCVLAEVPRTVRGVLGRGGRPEAGRHGRATAPPDRRAPSGRSIDGAASVGGLRRTDAGQHADPGRPRRRPAGRGAVGVRRDRHLRRADGGQPGRVEAPRRRWRRQSHPRRHGDVAP